MLGKLFKKKNHTYYIELGAKALAEGRLDDAERDYMHALELAEEARAHDDVAEASKKLGQIFELEDKAAFAEPHYSRAYRTHEDSEQHESAAECLIMLGCLYHKLHRFPEAEPVLQSAMSIYQQQSGKNAQGIARAANCLADCYLFRKSFAEAEKLLTRVIEIEQACNADDLTLAVENYKLALAYGGQSKDAQTESAFKKASQLFCRHEGLFDRQMAHTACACYHQLGIHYLRCGNQAEARLALKEAMHLAETYPGYLDEADLADKAAALPKLD